MPNRDELDLATATIRAIVTDTITRLGELGRNVADSTKRKLETIARDAAGQALELAKARADGDEAKIRAVVATLRDLRQQAETALDFAVLSLAITSERELRGRLDAVFSFLGNLLLRRIG